MLSGCTAKSDDVQEDDILKPQEQTFTEEDYQTARLYLEFNIIQYAPEEPVLGGSWYMTDVLFEGDRALVSYEDGHIARKTLVDLNIDSNHNITVINSIRVFSDERDEINASIGDRFAIALESNPTTGFKWNVGDLSGATILKEEGFIPSQGELVGAGGTEYFIYEAVAVGEDAIMLSYARPWESVQPLETKIFNVVVE